MAEFIVDTTNGIMNAKTTGRLVRCRECLHAARRDPDGLVVCDFWSSLCGNGAISRGADEYCSDAERREAVQWS
jgi:hypothetical protein